MRQGEGRDEQAAYAADVFADVRSALSAQQSVRATQAPALQQPTPAAPRTFYASHAAPGPHSSSSVRCLLLALAAASHADGTLQAPSPLMHSGLLPSCNIGCLHALQ